MNGSAAALAMLSSVEHDLHEIAEHVRRSTVQVRDGERAAGSGVIWRADGLIVTNAHVARGERQVVELADGRTFRARAIARHPRRDLAALEIDARDLPAIAVGDSRALRPGELVMALGHPLGVTNSLALGIVHASMGSNDDGWVRADVRLLPGNSGGPLVNARGELVGINAMVVNGLGVAVSSAMVRRFVGQLVEQRVEQRVG